MIFRKIKIFSILIASFIIVAIGFYFVADEQLHWREKNVPMIEGEEILAELNNVTTIEQQFVSSIDNIEKLSLKLVTLGRTNSGIVTVELIDCSTGKVLDAKLIESSLLVDGTYYEWVLNNRIEQARNRMFAISFVSECIPGQAPGIYFNSLINSGNHLLQNEETVAGSICFSYAGKEDIFLGKHYFKIALCIGIALAMFFLRTLMNDAKGKPTIIFRIYRVLIRYKFLMQQLILRDFKTKYKRSVLGYMWSFLNPLLTMIVQYVVFSTVFRADIKNFPVYLLSGIILFNFFSESVGQGLSSIIGNASLITKVYVPKYIYPVSRVLSCSINLFISMIPLLLMVLFTGTKLTKAVLLLPYVLICVLVFCIGMSLLLSSAMVFFRDTQYLWSIVSLAWMYATPLFYPESIIPEEFKFIHRFNPMYYMVKFIRCILIDGVSPEPELYLWCAISAIGALLIGMFVFKKEQDKFVLYL